MYFDSRKIGNRGLPWLDSRTDWDKANDTYFEELESLAAEIDDIEDCTSFISSLSPDDFGSGYRFVLTRLRELKEYLTENEAEPNRNEYIESLNDIYERLLVLYSDSALYDDDFVEEDDFDEDEDYDDDDWDDDYDNDDEDYLDD